MTAALAYSFTEEHLATRTLVRDLVTRYVAPRAAEIDATGEFPHDLFAVLAKHDVFAIAVPEKYGGAWVGSLGVVIAIEELAYACASTALILGGQHLGTLPLLHAGDDAQKERWLPMIGRGEAIPAYCVTEPETGSDVAAIRTRARQTPDGYVLDGAKRFVTNAGIADYYLVFARTGPAAGHAGISAFVVEKDRPGVSTPRLEAKMGIRGSRTGDVILDAVEVPVENLVGHEGQGFEIAMWVFDRSRPSIAAQAVGLARAALDHALEYCNGRKAFGKPLSDLQGLRWMAADAAVEVQAARELLYSCAAAIDRAGASEEEISMAAAMAKLKASEVAMAVTTTAVQMLGGYGYMREYTVERLMRDAKVTQIYEGTSQIQKEIIGRRLSAAGRLGD